MIFIKYKKNLVIFILYMIIIFLLLLLCVKLFYKEEKIINNDIKTSLISFDDKLNKINVKYPRFKNDRINSVITNVIYNYIKDFKKNNKKKHLYIDYNLYYIDKYVNIVFNIDNSLSNIKYKNILINLDNNSISYISDLFNEDELKDKINNLVYYKYSSDIYNEINNKSINNFTYIISDNRIIVYFNNININIDYIPYVSFNISN